MSRGLPNSGNYCYLNTVVQLIYKMKDIREEILNINFSEINKTELKKYQILYSLKKLFEYIKGKNADVNPLLGSSMGPGQIQLCMKDLDYDGAQEDSGETLKKLLGKAQSLLRQLKGKLPSVTLKNMIDIDGVNGSSLLGCIERTCFDFLSSSEKLYLILKGNRLIININRGNTNCRIAAIDQTLKLLPLIQEQVMVVKKSKNDVNLQDPVLYLVSASIYNGNGENGHYYVYTGKNNSWKCKNDSQVNTGLIWKDIVEDIREHATILVYQL